MAETAGARPGLALPGLAVTGFCTGMTRMELAISCYLADLCIHWVKAATVATSS